MSLASKVKQSNQTLANYPHLIVEARAGTGKTTTLVEGLKYAKGLPTKIQPSPQQAAVWEAMKQGFDQVRSCCFVAFNKSIATELQQRVPKDCSAMTMHSMGLKAVTAAYDRVKINSYRVQDIISELLERDIRELRREKFDTINLTEKLVGLCKMNLLEEIDDQALTDLAAQYDLDFNGGAKEAFELVPKVLERCKSVDQDRCIDFNDMIWLPIACRLFIHKYDLLLVDECVPGWTPIMLADGRSVTIKEIVESDKEFRVRAYDTKKGISKNCRVIGKQKLLNQKPLVKVKVKHLHRTGTNKKCNFVICTVDHKIWTINRGWVQSGNLQAGDTVIIETSAKTSQKGKITANGRTKLANLQIGNKRGLGNKGGDPVTFNRNKGGNGRGLTLAEQTLLNALGEGWKSGYVVKTGDSPQFGRGNKPSHYKLDLANPGLMIAVEVDGCTHRNSQETDAKKQLFLEERGWTVIRVSNRRAIQETTTVACEITGNCPKPARVVSVEPVSIPDNYVYDITVEKCHNFYANGILVHNCQDLNRCQQELALKAGRRLLLCGDKKQAIYGFAGADSQSMDRMANTLGTERGGVVILPLTVTRRCGKAIVAEAQKLVPDFEAHESNPEGKISRSCLQGEVANDNGGELPQSFNRIPYTKLAKEGDMVLCRCNGPLVSQCFRFLKTGRKANIQGRDIGQGLISTIKKMKAKTVSDLVEKLDSWLYNEQQKENRKRNPNETRLINLQDRYDCLACFCEDAIAVQDVIDKIERVFTDAKDNPGIKLSSIHKAKGLEAKRVFFLEPKGAECPHPMARTATAREQEMNLRYVAITRAIEELVYVTD